MISIALVILVVFLFLRNWRATLIPSVAVPVSLIGTFGVMYLCGYSLDNLSLMALTIATGFVVDDAIVVLENISRHIEEGMPPRAGRAARRARGRLHRAVDEPVADRGVHSHPADGRHRRAAVPRVRGHAVGGDPGLAGGLADHHADDVRARCCATSPSASAAALPRRASAPSNGMLRGYERTLGWALRHRSADDLVLLATVCLNVYLYVIVPKGFFPQQDTGRLIGYIQADQSISFQAMQQKLADFIEIVHAGSGGGERDRLHRRRPAQHRIACSSRSSRSTSASCRSTR